MRITLVSPFDPAPPAADPAGAHLGGVERVYAEVAPRLAARRHEVTVLCSTPGAPRTTRQDEVLYHRRRRYATILRAPVARIAAALPHDADIVQVPATYPLTTSNVLTRARRLGLPSVLDFHFEAAPPGVIGKTAGALHRTIGTRAYRQADAVLVRSMSYAQSAPSLTRVPQAKWRVVPNGVDVERFRPNGGETGDFILFVGRLVDYKGVDTLLRALARHPPKLPLMVVGDGPLRSSLQHLARRLQVDATFVGYGADKDLPRYYRQARVTVLPSRNRQEAFGMSLLESMACGTPVVASDLPGVADLAAWGGLVATPGDPDALGLQIRRACTAGLLPRGRTLADPIHATFSWDAITDRLERVYREIQAPDRRRGGVIPVAHPRGNTVL